MTRRPDPRELASLLRSCVQCGLCLPTCATWNATGNEVLSPRGRLVLMQRLLAAGEKTPGPETLQSFDLCIGCRACETACPSGVPFSLFEHGRELARKFHGSGTLSTEQPEVPGWLLKRLDRAPVLRALKSLSKFAVGPRLSRLAAGVPTAPRRDEQLTALLDGLGGVRESRPPHDRAAGDAAAADIDFFTGCANAGLLPDTSRRLIDLLRRCGCRVHIPTGQACCGALAGHSGRENDRAVLHQRNEQAFVPLRSERWIVVEAAGCGLELKEQMNSGQAEVLDATEALARLVLPPPEPVRLRVAYHAACHLEHGQKISAAPRDLLRAIPELELLEPEDPAICCGSGGVWSLEHPVLAAEVGAQKARQLIATGAQLIVTTNPGCLGQIKGSLAAEGASIPILPLTDLLWYACCR